MPRIVSTYKEEARKKVLETSLEVFKEKGFFKCTMGDIAERLGISKGAIYQYFGSKEQLLVALYSTGPEIFRSYASASSKGTIAAAKATFAEMATRDNANLFADFLAEASRNANLQRAIRENMEKFDTVVVDLLKEGNPKLSSKKIEQARGAATMLGLIYNGLWCWLVVGAPESEVNDLWGRAVDMLLAPYDRGKPTLGKS